MLKQFFILALFVSLSLSYKLNPSFMQNDLSSINVTNLPDSSIIEQVNNTDADANDLQSNLNSTSDDTNSTVVFLQRDIYTDDISNIDANIDANSTSDDTNSTASFIQRVIDVNETIRSGVNTTTNDTSASFLQQDSDDSSDANDSNDSSDANDSSNTNDTTDVTSSLPDPATDDENTRMNSQCIRRGCKCLNVNDSSTTGVCSSTESLCYDNAKCMMLDTGECGWLQTDELTTCIAQPKKCIRAGCNKELCVEEGVTDMVSQCIWKPYFQCYNYAKCTRNNQGQCEWQKTLKFNNCYFKWFNPRY
jgi:hypothetical protein